MTDVTKQGVVSQVKEYITWCDISVYDATSTQCNIITQRQAIIMWVL